MFKLSFFVCIIFSFCIISVVSDVKRDGKCGKFKAISRTDHKGHKCLRRLCCPMDHSASQRRIDIKNNLCETQIICLKSAGIYCTKWIDPKTSPVLSPMVAKYKDRVTNATYRKCCPKCFWNKTCKKGCKYEINVKPNDGSQ
jgi:hypothetical protein